MEIFSDVLDFQKKGTQKPIIGKPVMIHRRCNLTRIDNSMIILISVTGSGLGGHDIVIVRRGIIDKVGDEVSESSWLYVFFDSLMS